LLFVAAVHSDGWNYRVLEWHARSRDGPFTAHGNALSLPGKSASHDRGCAHRVAAAVHVRRPALVILIIGPLAALRTPVDIFPDIRIPVLAIVWQYTGLQPEQMAGRIASQSQRALTTTVNDIEHIEATSYNGLGIIKVFFQRGADIRLANAQTTAILQTQLKQMRPNTTPPLILNYNASTVPIIQLGKPRLYVDVPENYVPSIQIGTKARVAERSGT
jgi:AcrB/AcrD/AcrF family protein